MCQSPDTTGKPLTLYVGHTIKDRRIDKYLHGRFRNLSRQSIQDAIKTGNARVNGKIAKPSLKLTTGDRIDLVIPEPPSKEIPPEDIPLTIIHEDSDLIVINKQANMIVHPARGNTRGTLVNALAYYVSRLSSPVAPGTGHGTRVTGLSSGLGEFRPGIVHRLDKNTTGVMVVTKNDTAQWKIAKQFERRQVKKTYLAIVHGTPDLSADRVNAPLGVHPRIREKYAIRPEIGKEAITFYQVLEEFRGFSLLRLAPRTGRTHQIRVHLSYIKHPIVADDMYGGKFVYEWQLADAEPAPQAPIIKRCALHAHTLEFTHPTTGEVMKFEAPLPADMQNLLDMLRKYRKE